MSEFYLQFFNFLAEFRLLDSGLELLLLLLQRVDVCADRRSRHVVCSRNPHAGRSRNSHGGCRRRRRGDRSDSRPLCWSVDDNRSRNPHAGRSGNSHAYQKDKPSLRFMVLGDWGGLPLYPYRTGVEKDVAARMGKVAETMDYRFVLGLGDNFYFDGVQNEFDKRFEETFEDVFTAKSLDIPWYFIAGNHDHNGNITAQIAYTNRTDKKSKKWNFPSLYYSLNFTVPGTNTTVTIIQYDSVTLCGNSDDRRPGLLMEPENFMVATSQLQWLEQQLKAAKSDYLIVTAHYPVWSIAEHGPTKCLVNDVKPLLERYGVTAYFSGHDHNLQHLKENSSSVEYFVVGCANFIDPSQKHKDDVPDDSLKFFWAEGLGRGGFAHVQVTEEDMTFTFLESSDGKELYQTTMKPRKRT